MPEEKEERMKLNNIGAKINQARQLVSSAANMTRADLPSQSLIESAKLVLAESLKDLEALKKS